MRIKLISPRMSLRPVDSQFKTHMAPPLALLVLGALTPRRHTVTVADENVERVDHNDRPDLVGITVKVDTAHRSAEIARQYRRRGIPVVYGGIHPTACPETCLPHCDAVVIGEAEGLWASVLDDAETGRLKRVYRAAAPWDPALSPAPRWDLIAGKNYLFSNTLVVGRGCPWRCEFCYSSGANFAHGYRMKPLENILAEIRSLGVRHVMFIDDNFIGHPARARRLVTALMPLGLTWHAAVSADIGCHEDLLDMMADAGCKSLFIGFESINPASLASCRKSQNQVHLYDRTVEAIHRRGMMVDASLVFGFDGDTPETFEHTMDWLVSRRIETMTGHILTPYPGTPLYERLMREGRIIDHDLRHYNTSHVVFRPARMSPEVLREGYLWMYREFYSWQTILQRLPARTDRLRPYLAFNLVYRKARPVARWIARLGLMGPLGRLGKTLAYGLSQNPMPQARCARSACRAEAPAATEP